MDPSTGAALDSLSVVFMAVLLSGVWNSRAKSISNSLYTALIIAVGVLLGADLVYLSLLGTPGEPFHAVLLAAKSLYFAANTVVIWSWAFYVEYTVLGASGRFKALRVVYTGIAAVNIAIVAASLFVGCMFTIAPDGRFAVHELWMWVFTTLNYLSALVMLIALLSQSKAIRRGVLVRFVLFPLIPLVAELVHLADPNIVLTCAYAVSAMMVYQISQNDLAYSDELTGLGNRRQIVDSLNRWFRDAHETVVCGIMIDLDGLKRINDEHGHACGDEALTVASSLIKSKAPKESVPARYGGDEFIIAWCADEGPEPETVAAQIEKAKAAANETPASWGPIDFSIGAVRCSTKECRNPTEFIARLDSLMYEAKRQKKLPRADGKAC